MGLAIAHELLTESAKNVALIGTNKQKGQEAINILNNHYGKNRAIFFCCNVQNRLEVCGKCTYLFVCVVQLLLINSRMLQSNFKRVW